METISSDLVVQEEMKDNIKDEIYEEKQYEEPNIYYKFYDDYIRDYFHILAIFTIFLWASNKFFGKDILSLLTPPFGTIITYLLYFTNGVLILEYGVMILILIIAGLTLYFNTIS